MKTHLVFGAMLAAAAAPAPAQSNTSGLTLYGIVDGAMVSQSARAPAGSLQSLNSGFWQASQFGLRGTESLGSDLKAVFSLSSNLQLDTGTQPTSRLFDRHAYVGLSSDTWGTITLGRQVTTLAELFFATDPLAAGNGATNMNVRYGYLGGAGALIGNRFGTSASTPGNNLDRQDNAVKYAYKSGGGLMATAMYAFGEAAGAANANRSGGLLLGYDSGAVQLRAAAMQFKDAAGVSLNAYAVGGGYDFGNVQLKGTWTQNKIDSGIAPYGNLMTQVFSGGVTWSPSAALRLTLAYYQGRRSQDGQPTQVAKKAYFIPEYSLSKRTELYSLIALERFNAEGAALDNGTPLAPGATASNIFSVGISHRF